MGGDLSTVWEETCLLCGRRHVYCMGGDLLRVVCLPSAEQFPRQVDQIVWLAWVSFTDNNEEGLPDAMGTNGAVYNFNAFRVGKFESADIGAANEINDLGPLYHHANYCWKKANRRPNMITVNFAGMSAPTFMQANLSVYGFLCGALWVYIYNILWVCLKPCCA